MKMKPSSWLSTAALAAALACAAPAQAGLVANGGFETEDFTGWTLTGDTSFNGVQCPGPDASVHEGACSAFFGTTAVGGIEQVISVGSAGIPWHLSFALQADGGLPSNFQALFGGISLLMLTDPAAGGMTLYQFDGLTNAANMTLAFNFMDQAGILFFDDVRLSVPEPATGGLLAAAMAGLVLSRRRRSA